MVDVLGGVVVLDDLVLEHAAAGLLDRELRQRDAGLVRGHGGLVEDLVDLLLREVRERLLRRAHAHELRLEGLDGVDERLGGCCRCFPRHAVLLHVIDGTERTKSHYRWGPSPVGIKRRAVEKY